MNDPIGYIFKSNTDKAHYPVCPSCWDHYGTYYKQYCRDNIYNRIYPIFKDQLESVRLTCVYYNFGGCEKQIGVGYLDSMLPPELKELYETLCQMEEV